MDEERMAMIAELVDKIMDDQVLTPDELKKYDEIMQDDASKKAFLLYAEMLDMPGLMAKLMMREVENFALENESPNVEVEIDSLMKSNKGYV